MFIKLTYFTTEQPFFLDSDRIVKFEDGGFETPSVKVHTETETILVLGDLNHLAKVLNGEALEEVKTPEEKFLETIATQ